MIKQVDNTYILETNNSSYVFRVLESGHPEHLYYGKKIRLIDSKGQLLLDSLCEKHAFMPGNNNAYDKEHMTYTLNDMRLEFSSNGKGDNRQPFVELIHGDGSRTSDFVFEKAEIVSEKRLLKDLPSSYGECQGLIVTFLDKNYNLELELSYYVFEECDVITRSARLINNSDDKVRILRLMSLQVDDYDSDYTLTSFNGAWAREMEMCRHQLTRGTLINESCAGVSSSTANPFFMLGKKTTNEDKGQAYGFNLVYSGNHVEYAEVSEFGKLRILSGINPRGFEYSLEPGCVFEAPEAVMTYSDAGYNGMSQNMHQFVKKHILRGYWADKERPVLLNSWEAAYFNISESKLLKMAKAGKEAGIELFVMDDGWFGERNDDTSSLGDWYPNKKKLPSGVKGISDKIHDLGMKFGIWLEPEMISSNSELYKKHPDWAMQIPGKPHSEGRNQMIIDMANREVQDYLIETISNLLSEGEVDYVKWDMNRTMTDVYSPSLLADKQGEVAYRYVLGLYRVLDKLTNTFPNVLFEGCASGGNRFDLGALCYFPQIWASDDTDALERVKIQTGYSYGYPLCTMGAHVSGVPNHQTLRITPLSTRFNVAAYGSLGYECNFSDLDNNTLDEIKEEIKLYKAWRQVFQYGRFYRTDSIFECNEAGWMVVSEDKSEAVFMNFQGLVRPNDQRGRVKLRGLDRDALYHFYNLPFKIDIRMFGDLVNAVSPVHIKNGSFAHNMLAKFVKMDGEKEDYKAYGDSLMEGGVMLSPKFSATGFNDKTRVYPDFSSRMYFLEKEE